MTYETFLAGLHPEDRDRTDTSVQNSLDPAGDEALDVEYRTIGLEDGVERWVAARGKGFFEDGRPVRLIGTVRDIGVRKRAEALMVQAMEHQNILTREVSHRVKNSLQLVAALLTLQAKAATDRSVRHAIEEAGARIATVARVHDHLWHQPDVQIVDLAAFLGDLCKNLSATVPQYRLNCDIDPITISTDRAIPIGLLINELVTNALKYAYRTVPGLSGSRPKCRTIEGTSALKSRIKGWGCPAGSIYKHPPAASE